jgi:hypothetical protein
MEEEIAEITEIEEGIIETIGIEKNVIYFYLQILMMENVLIVYHQII